MPFDIFYRRPSYVSTLTRSPSSSSSSTTTTMKDLSPTTSRSSSPSSNIRGIPSSLSFDKIIQGGTCPPLTCRDFMNYLLYVEHSAENLQFYLWLLDYTTRFANIPASEQALSSEVGTLVYATPEATASKNSIAGHRSNKTGSKVFFADSFQVGKSSVSVPTPTKENPFRASTQTPGSPRAACYNFESMSDVVSPLQAEEGSVRNVDHASVTAEAFRAVGLEWQPFTIQPFREEITRVISIYIAEGSPRELNVSARDRVAALRALAQTTHPSALEPLKKVVEDTLKLQAHPNFVRWSIRNGNTPRVRFAVGLGIATIIVGFLVAVLLTLSRRARGLRALAALAWVVGISTLIAASKGMCVVLHGLHHRHVRPWELWVDGGSYELEEAKASVRSMTNGYEDEPWVAKYAERNVIRKIFDREVWVEEPALRQIQDQIFWQSILIALVTSAGLAAVFVVLPKGGFI